MDDKTANEDRNKLGELVAVGIMLQTVYTVVAFWVKKGQVDYLDRLNALIADFKAQMTEEEAQELNQDIREGLDRKAQEFTEEMMLEMGEEEAERMLKWMKGGKS